MSDLPYEERMSDKTPEKSESSEILEKSGTPEAFETTDSADCSEKSGRSDKTISDEELVKMYRGGNAAAFDELYERYKYVLKAASHSFYLAGGDNDDLMQEGVLGFLSAVNGYNGKSMFKTYAYCCIRSKILNAVRNSQSIKNRPLNGYVSIYGTSPELKKLFEYDPEQQLINDENANELLNDIQNVLSKFEFSVFQNYLYGLSYTEIGEKMGKDPKCIDNALSRIKRKISLVILNR